MDRRWDSLTWCVESSVFPPRYENLVAAIEAIGPSVVHWRDDWKREGLPNFSGSVLFHGSLENAAWCCRNENWTPGAFCSVERFYCSRWYPQAKELLLNSTWVATTVANLVSSPMSILSPLGNPESIFVRPDSPLKPFSGRVVSVDALSLSALDHGFYYDDEQLPIIVAPIRQVNQEWRFVVVDRKVIAGSEYVAANRQASGRIDSGEVWKAAAEMAAMIDPPELVYVLDLCRSGSELRLLELNPFSGADLYDCNPEAIAECVTKAVCKASQNAS